MVTDLLHLSAWVLHLPLLLLGQRQRHKETDREKSGEEKLSHRLVISFVQRGGKKKDNSAGSHHQLLQPHTQTHTSLHTTQQHHMLQ